MSTDRHRLFRVTWWTSNALLAVFFVSLIYSAGWEYSVRQYLRGFSDAVVPASAMKITQGLRYDRLGLQAVRRKSLR